VIDLNTNRVYELAEKGQVVGWSGAFNVLQP
jgi:hypothetical protein